jgi:lysophospholipase L1-like esterase
MWKPFAFVIAALSLLLGVGLGEIALRLRCTYCQWTELNKEGYKSPFKEPSVNTWYYTRTPNQISSYEQPEFDFELLTNSYGVRDETHPIRAQEGEFRIIGLGDSFTEGQGAAFEDTYLKVLERNLNDRAVQTVRVISGGVAGSDPLYEFKLLRDKLLVFEPDLVIVAINRSDVSDLMFRGGAERFTEDGRVKFNQRPRVEALYRWSHLFRFVMMRFLGYDWLGFSPAEQAQREVRAIEDLESAVGAFQQLAEDRSFALLVVLHPMLWELSTEAYNFDAIALMDYMTKNQIQFLDLMDYLAKRVPEEGVEELYWKRDKHHNAAGYELFGEGVEAHILDLGLIDRKR